MINLNVLQDRHVQIANLLSATTVHVLTFFPIALIILLALPIYQFVAILETVDKVRTTVQLFLPALTPSLYFARMVLAESLFSTVKVLPTLPFLKEKSAALMVLSHSHYHSALLALLAQLDISNAGTEPVYPASYHALLLVMLTMVLSDAQMVLSEQTS